MPFTLYVLLTPPPPHLRLPKVLQYSFQFPVIFNQWEAHTFKGCLLVVFPFLLVQLQLLLYQRHLICWQVWHATPMHGFLCPTTVAHCFSFFILTFSVTSVSFLVDLSFFKFSLMVQCWVKCKKTLWETTSANRKESIIRWHISWCPRELIALHEPFLIDWSLSRCFCCFISASSCVRKWEDPHDSVVYCIDSDNKWMVISGTNRYGVVSKICITLWVNGFWG